MGGTKSTFWRKKASQFLEEHSAIIQQPEEEEEEEGKREEDSQGLEECGGDTPDELGQSSGEEDEEVEEYEEEEGERGGDAGRIIGGGAAPGRPKRSIHNRVNVSQISGTGWHDYRNTVGVVYW